MARRNGIQLDKIIGAVVFFGALKYYIVPKFMTDMEHTSKAAIDRNMQNYRQSIAKQKADEQARQNEAFKPVYVDKPHQGYTIHKAEIRTCAMPQCTVVGHLPKETMVKWDKIENGYINYDSVYFIKFSDVKQLF